MAHMTDLEQYLQIVRQINQCSSSYVSGAPPVIDKQRSALLVYEVIDMYVLTVKAILWQVAFFQKSCKDNVMKTCCTLLGFCAMFSMKFMENAKEKLC